MSKPSKDFKFRSGKYQGKTYEWVLDNDPSYIKWVEKNVPKMLIEQPKGSTKSKINHEPFKIKPNMNFDNE